MVFTLRSVGHAVGTLALVLMSHAGFAQDYPSRPIRFIIPTAPSGGADVLARAVGERLSERLKQPVVYDNRAGAGGSIGSDLAAKSPPDGYTILIVTSAHAINPSLYGKLAYDTVKDFAPVGLVGGVSFVLSAHPSVPVRSLKDLIALAKKRPRELNYGSAGNGSSNHMAMEFFKMTAGIDLVHVPYKGGAPATTGLLSGEVHANFSSPPHVIPHIRSKRLNGLAVTSPKRLGPLPELPTIAESGFSGYRESGWYGILAPAGTPKAIIDQLNGELVKIQAHPALQSFYQKRGIEPPTETSPAEFGELIRSEIVKYGKVVRQADIRINRK